MLILILHAWLRGNLGDEMITRQVINALRSGWPGAAIHIISIPADDQYSIGLDGGADRITQQEPGERVESYIKAADVVLIAPGGGLQKQGDYRAQYIYRDVKFALSLNKPVVFSGHSVHPALCDPVVLRRCVFVAREPASFRYLLQCGVVSVEAADYAFLVPVPADVQKNGDVLIFLRFDHFQRIVIEPSKRTLLADGLKIDLPDGDLVLSSSDWRRDGARLRELSEMTGIRCEPAATVAGLIDRIAHARSVITDRYHPAILAKMTNTDVVLLPQPIFRDTGLQQHLALPYHELKCLAQNGIEALTHAIAQ